jgi:hypothetical protein
VSSRLEPASTALTKGLAAILMVALLTTSAFAATGSTSIQRVPSSWESFGSKLPLPHEGLDSITPIEPRIRLTHGAVERLS